MIDNNNHDDNDIAINGGDTIGIDGQSGQSKDDGYRTDYSQDQFSQWLQSEQPTQQERSEQSWQSAYGQDYLKNLYGNPDQPGQTQPGQTVQPEQSEATGQGFYYSGSQQNQQEQLGQQGQPEQPGRSGQGAYRPDSWQSQNYQQAQPGQSVQPEQSGQQGQNLYGSGYRQSQYGNQTQPGQAAQPEQPGQSGRGAYRPYSWQSQPNAHMYYQSIPAWQGPYYGQYAYAQTGPQYYGQYYHPHPTNGKKKGMKPWQKGLIIFLAITLGMLFFGILISNTKSPGSSFVGFGTYVAQLNVEGVIDLVPESDYLGYSYGYNHQWTLDKIDELISDTNNKGLLIYVNSPGGGVYASDELYLKIKEYQKECERPVYVVMGSVAASGAYYIAAPADKIYANRNTWTGSIGVTMGTIIDVSDFLSEHGVRTVTIISGKNKAMGGIFDPMTEEQKLIFQGLVDEAYDQFTGIVAEGRDISIADVRNLADGRIYTAKQAMELDLIDEIGSKDDAFLDMQEVYGLESSTLQEFYYTNVTLLGRAFGSETLQQLMTIIKSSKGDIATVLELVGRVNRMPLRYQYEG